MSSHIWLLLGMMDMFEALFMFRQIYLALQRSEDVRVALSLLKQTYLDLKRNEDVMTALSMLLRFSMPLLRMSEDKEQGA